MVVLFFSGVKNRIFFISFSSFCMLLNNNLSIYQILIREHQPRCSAVW